MKYLLTALLILSAGTAGAASGNLGADGNTQLPNITVTNTTTMNKAILTGNLTIQGTTNAQVFLSSKSFSAASSVSFGLTAPSSSTVYCVFTATQTSPPGYPYLTFNGDSAGHYLYGTVTTATGVTTIDNNNGASYISMEDTGHPFSKKYEVSFSFITGSAGSLDTEVGGQSSGYGTGASGFCLTTWAGQWTNGVAPTYGTITTSGGTMQGFIRCTYASY